METTPQFKQSSPSPLRWLIFGLLTLVIIAAIGFGVVKLLQTLAQPSRPSQEASVSLAPGGVIKEYGGAGLIAALSADKYQQESTSGEAQVIYKLKDRSYVAHTTTAHRAYFMPKNSDLPEDTTLVQDQTAAFMKTKGYNKIDNEGGAKSAMPAYITFES